MEKIKLTKSNINLINPNDLAFFSLALENTRENPSCFEIILKDKKIYYGSYTSEDLTIEDFFEILPILKNFSCVFGMVDKIDDNWSWIHLGAGKFLIFRKEYYNKFREFLMKMPKNLQAKLYVDWMKYVIEFLSFKENNENEEIVYCYVSIKYDDYLGDKKYSYIVPKDIEEVNIGDTVLVDRAGKKVRGEVVDKNFYNKSNVPYPLERTKNVIKVLKTPEELNKYILGKNKKFRCPCCGYYTMPEVDMWDICPVCFWEYDPLQSDEPTYSGGANKPCLNEARKNYKKFKAIEEEFVKYVRPPKLYETEYIEFFNDEKDIFIMLRTGPKEEISTWIKEFEIEYKFDLELEEYLVNINKFGINMSGKMFKNFKHNCIEFFGNEFSYKKLLKKCPLCNGQLVDILYGFPTFEAFQKAEREELYLGGCCVIVGIEQAVYYCYSCDRKFFEDLSEKAEE